MWLRELTEPLVPSRLYDDAVAVGRQGPAAGHRQLAKFLAKMPTDNKRIVTRLSDFLKNMDVRKTRMDFTNLAIVFAPCFLRHDDVNVFMANRDFEVEFTRRVLVYAGGEGSTYKPATTPAIAIARTSISGASAPETSVPNSQMPVVDGMLQVPEFTPPLNPDAVPQVDAELKPASSLTLAELRRERQQSTQEAAEQAYEVEHQARLAAEACEELAEREEQEAAEELKQTEAQIRSLSSSSSTGSIVRLCSVLSHDVVTSMWVILVSCLSVFC
jgi:hypothetical protein